jgi:large subunit ribosomal protein L18
MKRKSLNTGRVKRSDRIRNKIQGTPEIPRLCIYRSLSNIYAQLIDDVSGKTLVSVSSISKDIKPTLSEVKGKVNLSKVIGKSIAEKAVAANITSVVFDRNGYRYHGRVKAVADAARENGLKF